MTTNATVKIPGNANFCGGEIQNAKFQSLISKDNATEGEFWYDSVTHKPMYNNGTTNKEFGKEYSVFTGADGTNVGTSGLVPAPNATDNTKFLCGDGTYKTPEGRNYTFSTGLTNDNDTISVTNYDRLIKNNAHPNASNQIAIGLNASTNFSYGYQVAIGSYTQTSGNYCIALGDQAKMSNGVTNAIQIGQGTNDTSNTFQVWSYKLLDKTTGLIPDERLSNNIAKTSAIPTTVAELTDSSNYALKTDINKVYKASGTVASASALPTLSASVLGNVYNVTTAFNTTSDFVEGAGKNINVGNDIAVVNIGTDSSPVYKFNVLGDFVDISGKQDIITDLGTIRSGAALGSTALQSISSSDVTTALGYTPCKRISATNSALTSSNGVCTWNIPNTLATADVQVSVYEVGSNSNTIVYPAVEANANTVTVSLLSTENISAGAYKAVIAG